MLKKALLAGVLGVVLASGAAFAGSHGHTPPGQSGGCPGCEVSRPDKLEFGLDLKIDIDVCVDAGNLMGCQGDDCWSAKAVVFQDGNHNKAFITQRGSNVAGIVQDGNHNFGSIYQNSFFGYALMYQDGTGNKGYITQFGFAPTALMIQKGSHNLATITQY